MEAINLLATGMTQVATADAIGIHRVTLSNWVRKDPRVRAELNRRLQERAEATSVRVQSLVESSLDVLRPRSRKIATPRPPARSCGSLVPRATWGGHQQAQRPSRKLPLQMALDEERLNAVLRLLLVSTEPPAHPISLLGNLPGPKASNNKRKTAPARVRQEAEGG